MCACVRDKNRTQVSCVRLVWSLQHFPFTSEHLRFVWEESGHFNPSSEVLYSGEAEDDSGGGGGVGLSR